MRHLFLDQHSGLDSFIHRLDPRTKIATFITIVFFIVTTPTARFAQLSLYFAVLTALTLFSRVPFAFVLKKAFITVPFVMAIGVFTLLGQGDSALFRSMTARAFLAVMSLSLMVSTTPFSYFLKGLERLRLPGIFIMVLSFMYRYLFVSVDELMRMKQAKDARTISPKGRFEIKALANIIGSLFIRSYERGERVYLAMCSRGFSGKIKTLNTSGFGRADALFGAGIALALLCIKTAVLS